MRLVVRLTVVGLFASLIPLSASVITILVQANAQVADLIERNATLELEFLQARAQSEFDTIERLGISSAPFYISAAKSAVVRYGAERSIPGGFLFAIDADGNDVLMGGSIEPGDFVIEDRFEPFDWTLGVAIARQYVNSFVRNSTITVVSIAIAVYVAAALIFVLVVRGMVRPIERLEEVAAAIANGDLSARADVRGRNEIARLGATFNRMAGIVEQLTLDLEHQVVDRTKELQESLDDLRAAQDLLVQRERMATLGRLVAGVAHEVNTPIGIGVTSSTFLMEKAEQWLSRIREDRSGGASIPASEIRPFIQDAYDASEIVHRSLERAESLIGTFKSLAVDQVSGQHRIFDLCAYLNDIAESLRPQAKRAQVEIVVRCEGELWINSYPGHIYQIITNLALNSMTHAFPGEESGTVTIDAFYDDEELVIVHADDGAGMSDEQISRIYEPFYTTRLGSGGSGLGMNIVFNTINQSLDGRIFAQSGLGAGSVFTIRIPKERVAVEPGPDPSS